MSLPEHWLRLRIAYHMARIRVLTWIRARLDGAGPKR